MNDDSDIDAVLSVDGEARSKRRRRRRRKKRAPGEAPAMVETRGSPDPDDDPRPRAGGRRAFVDVEGAGVSTAASGRNPHRKRSSRPRRGKPGSAAARRRRIGRVELQQLQDWMSGLSEPLLAAMYKGLGGQPKKVGDKERMLQLAVRALAQGGRLDVLARQLHERERKALAALLQCGGVAHAEEFHRTLSLAFGGRETDWKRPMTVLAERGIVFASPRQDEHFFYLVPDPLFDGLVEALAEDLALPRFEHEEVRVIEHKPFSPPLDFSITTLATYLSQNGVRLTQRHEVHHRDAEALHGFFSQLWEPESELFQFHLEFLMMHGMVSLRGDHLALDREVLEEWLQLEPEDQRDLVFRALERRFELGEWVLWAVHEAGGAWVAERPLGSMYRHWKRGREWRNRLASGTYAPQRQGERDSFTFSPLVQSGLLEMGQWGQEKFYRLTPRAIALLEPPEDEGFKQFYLTPDFKIHAPAGLAPILLFRMGEIAELVGCDRANTYRITEASIEHAIEAGWKRDDVLQFLREGSSIGLPENVEQTLKGWIGHRGDVEFHDLCLITVHRSQIRRLEGMKRLKPYLLHRFAPGMYAVDRARRDELEALLQEAGFAPSHETRTYPGTAEAVEARASLHRALAEAREAVQDPMTRTLGALAASLMAPVPGARLDDGGKAAEPDQPPMVDATQARVLVDRALTKDAVLEMVYLAKNGQRIACEVQPQRLAIKDGSPVLVGLDMNDNERRTYVLDRIERLRLQGAADA